MSKGNKTTQDAIKAATYYDLFYCGSDVGIYLGSQWLEDIISIQYTLTNNKAPVHGYMSEKFDAVARGSYVVQGQFAIAFQDANYLGKALANYRLDKDSEYSVLADSGTGTNGTKVIRPDRFGYIKKAYKKSIGYGFDIYIQFGARDYRSFTSITLLNVHVTSESMVIQPTGEPIAEIYSFFAQDIQYGESESFLSDASIPSLNSYASIEAYYADLMKLNPEPEVTGEAIATAESQAQEKQQGLVLEGLADAFAILLEEEERQRNSYEISLSQGTASAIDLSTQKSNNERILAASHAFADALEESLKMVAFKTPYQGFKTTKEIVNAILGNLQHNEDTKDQIMKALREGDPQGVQMMLQPIVSGAAMGI